MSPIDAAPVPAALRGLRVAVLVTGGIAAYKVADMVSQLVQAGAQVRVGMTRSAMRFVGAATFQGLSGRPVQTDLWDASGPAEPHVGLGDWAQLILVAPATANTISKLARGAADDIVSATLLAARAPLVLAPAMNDAMWAKPALQENIDRLHSRGIRIVEPESGPLASGHIGPGRLASTAAIFGTLGEAATGAYDLAGAGVVVTAGGTREPIDPVRFISNYSSGKMGGALAAAAADRGARVTLVSAGRHEPYPGIELVAVETAEEMLQALRAALPGARLLVMAAAVADYRVATPSPVKLKREARARLRLDLVRNVDILATLAADPAAAGVYRVGFAAEDDDLEARAGEKLASKGLDAIVANDISRSDIGFGSDHNEAVVLFAGGIREHLARTDKRRLADRLLDLLVPRLA